MTKVLFHGSIQGFRGRIGNMIFRQLPDGTTVVTAAPAKKTGRQKKRAKEKRSPAQKAHNNSFKEATAYAKRAQLNPVYVELAAAAPTKTAYNFAVSDWCYAPEIHRIEQNEGRIRVQATDNVMVTRVRVTLLDQDGQNEGRIRVQATDNVMVTRVRVTLLDQDRQIVEAGEAVKQKGDWWEFATQAQGKTIIAEAWDLPGHVTKFIAE